MAAAPQQNRTPRDVVEFAPNVPVTVALKYGQGKLIAGQYGERVMFTTVDNKIFFLSVSMHPSARETREHCL